MAQISIRDEPALHMGSETSDARASEPYRQTAEQVLAAFGVGADSGLGGNEARARLESHGRNELRGEEPVPGWRKFLAQFTDLLVVLLIVAALTSAGLWLYERDTALPYEAIAIFAIVLLNALLGFVQPHQASKQQRAHFRDRGPNWMALFAVQIPEDNRIVGVAIVGKPDFGGPPGERFVGLRHW